MTAVAAEHADAAGPVVDVRDAFCLHPLPGGGAVAALRGLTLAVGVGERVVVHGPNGSGKTTLLRVLAGEQALSAGRAMVAGTDLAAAARRELAAWRARRLGWVDQHPARTLRPELDVVGNVALQLRLAGTGPAPAREAAMSALTNLRVDHLWNRAPSTLSGGEAQRVAVAAALAHGPALVLADEPTGELDAVTADAVYDALADAVASAGAALVLVTHDRRAARVADRVVRIRDGRISETWLSGNPTPVSPEEFLVVDDRGWLRLPEPLRRAVGMPETMGVRRAGASVVLTPVPGGPVATAEPVPSRGPTHEPAEPVDPRPGIGCAPLVRMRGIGLAYGGRCVLEGLDLDVEEGRLLVVRGRSGTGKSTLLRVLVGLERPDTGTVCVAGADLATLDRAGLARLRRECAAVVLQQVHLAETVDAVANLELARAVRGQPSQREADVVGLHAIGVASVAHRNVATLSGGERQRVAVARALAVGARLVVLDEPSAQLDEAGAEQLAGVLATAAAKGTTLVVASHDPVLVAVADRVLDLEAHLS